MEKVRTDVVDDNNIALQRRKVGPHEDKARPKRKKRKKDLEELHRKVLKAKQVLTKRTAAGVSRQTKFTKLLNNFANKRQENDNETQGIDGKTGKRKGPRKICNRLLPKPLAGIYRNGAKGKDIRRADLPQSELNAARREGDVFKLLNGNVQKSKDTLAEKIFDEIIKGSTNDRGAANDSEATPSSHKQSPILGKIQGPKRKSLCEKRKDEETVLKQLDLEKVPEKNAKMKSETMACAQKEDKCKRRLFQNDEEEDEHAERQKKTQLQILIKPNQNKHKNERANLVFDDCQKKDRSKERKNFKDFCWSPISRYRELCTQICSENFQDKDLPVHEFSDPLSNIKEILRGYYADTFLQQFLREKSKHDVLDESQNTTNVCPSENTPSCFTTLEVQACTDSKNSEFSEKSTSDVETSKSHGTNYNMLKLANGNQLKHSILFSMLTKNMRINQTKNEASNGQENSRNIAPSSHTQNIFKNVPENRKVVKQSRKEQIKMWDEINPSNHNVDSDVERNWSETAVNINGVTINNQQDLLTRHLNDMRKYSNEKFASLNSSCYTTSERDFPRNIQQSSLIKGATACDSLNFAFDNERNDGFKEFDVILPNGKDAKKRCNTKSTKHVPAILRRCNNVSFQRNNDSRLDDTTKSIRDKGEKLRNKLHGKFVTSFEDELQFARNQYPFVTERNEIPSNSRNIETPDIVAMMSEYYGALQPKIQFPEENCKDLRERIPEKSNNRKTRQSKRALFSVEKKEVFLQKNDAGRTGIQFANTSKVTKTKHGKSRTTKDETRRNVKHARKNPPHLSNYKMIDSNTVKMMNDTSYPEKRSNVNLVSRQNDFRDVIQDSDRISINLPVLENQKHTDRQNFQEYIYQNSLQHNLRQKTSNNVMQTSNNNFDNRNLYFTSCNDANELNLQRRQQNYISHSNPTTALFENARSTRVTMEKDTNQYKPGTSSENKKEHIYFLPENQTNHFVSPKRNLVDSSVAPSMFIDQRSKYIRNSPVFHGEDLSEIDVLRGVQNLQILPSEPKTVVNQYIPNPAGSQQNNLNTVLVQDVVQPVKYLALENSQRIPLYAFKDSYESSHNNFSNHQQVILDDASLKLTNNMNAQGTFDQFSASKYQNFQSLQNLQSLHSFNETVSYGQQNQPVNSVSHGKMKNPLEYANMALVRYPKAKALPDFRQEDTSKRSNNNVLLRVQKRQKNSDSMTSNLPSYLLNVQQMTQPETNIIGTQDILCQVPIENLQSEKSREQRSYVTRKDFEYQSNFNSLVNNANGIPKSFETVGVLIPKRYLVENACQEQMSLGHSISKVNPEGLQLSYEKMMPLNGNR